LDIHYNGWYILKNNLLVDMTSLGHGGFEDELSTLKPNSLEEFKSYRKKLNELNFGNVHHQTYRYPKQKKKTHL